MSSVIWADDYRSVKIIILRLFIILEMHPLAAASRSRLTVRNVLLYMRSHGSALNPSLHQT